MSWFEDKKNVLLWVSADKNLALHSCSQFSNIAYITEGRGLSITGVVIASFDEIEISNLDHASHYLPPIQIPSALQQPLLLVKLVSMDEALELT